MRLLPRAALVVLAACGRQPRTPPPVPVPDAGPANSAHASVPSPPPSGLPPMATMPPAGVVGSKKAKPRSDPALRECVGGIEARGKDPGELVKRIGEACAAPSKMKAVGGVQRGQQGDRDSVQASKFKVEANHCYRVYVAAEEAARDLVVVVRDSAGDIVAEAPGPAVPQDGAACFTTSDEVSLIVGVGSGKGAWAAQVWGD